MTLKQRLDDLSCSISLATTNPPDEYPEWSAVTYETHMADLKELWSEIRPKLKDLDQAEVVDGKLKEMIDAFDAGEKEKGRAAAWFLYNLDVNTLR